MKKKLLVRNIFTAVLAFIIIISTTAGSVLASETNQSVAKKSSKNCYIASNTVASKKIFKKERIKVRDKFLNAEGKMEQVIRVNKDGSFVTEEVDLRIKGKKKACSHPAGSLKAIANLAPKTVTMAQPNCCFKHCTVTLNRCQQCGNGSIKTYGAWINHKKHNFPFLGKKCKTCGYKK